MWRVLPTHCVTHGTYTRPVLFYYIMHYYLLIVLLSVLTSLEPILDKPVSSPRTIERVEPTVRFDSAHIRTRERNGARKKETKEKQRKYQLKHTP